MNVDVVSGWFAPDIPVLANATEQWRWPVEPPGFVFLGRALQQAGRARFGADWVGNEFGVLWPLSLPEAPLRTGDLHRVHVLLHRHRPERGLPTPPEKPISRAPPPPPSLASYMAGVRRDERWVPPYEPTTEDIAEARVVIAELTESARPAIARVAELTRCFAIAALNRELRVAYRYSETGQMYECPPEWWNTEAFGLRFSSCSIVWQDPFDRGAFDASKAKRHPREPLYLIAADFEAWLPTIRAGEQERPSWLPRASEQLTAWCQSAPADAEARRRAIEAGNASERAICRHLSHIWHVEAGRTGGSAKSIQTIRGKGRQVPRR